LRRYAEHLGRAAQLKSAATVEFLVDDADRVYFLEINPRLQVEHGLTELVHGVDLVHAQLQLEFGDPVAALSWVDPLQGSPGTQVASGHAIECRINAEHPLTGWPSPGRIESVDWPQGSGVRIDTYLRSGSQVPPYYDSLLAKILVWGADRSAAVIRMQEALRTVRIRGVMTNLDLLVAAMAHPDFTHERYDTALLPRLVEQLRATSAASEQKSRSAW
jgi:acetyl-CoA carboxylase biotin carboxylase subunit